MAAMDELDLSRATWRKSTHSNNGGDCVEVTHASVRASDALSGAGGNGAAAVRPAPVIAVRDSKDPGGPVLSFGPAAWHAFAARLK